MLKSLWSCFDTLTIYGIPVVPESKIPKISPVINGKPPTLHFSRCTAFGLIGCCRLLFGGHLISLQILSTFLLPLYLHEKP